MTCKGSFQPKAFYDSMILTSCVTSNTWKLPKHQVSPTTYTQTCGVQLRKMPEITHYTRPNFKSDLKRCLQKLTECVASWLAGSEKRGGETSLQRVMHRGKHWESPRDGGAGEAR